MFFALLLIAIWFHSVSIKSIFGLFVCVAMLFHQAKGLHKSQLRTRSRKRDTFVESLYKHFGDLLPYWMDCLCLHGFVLYYNTLYVSFA